jgi:CRP/FNR family cyclic AMP-dependent transcriptional regulator
MSLAALATLASGNRAAKEGLVEDAEIVLRRAPLFEGLDEESARALRRQMSEVKLSRGEHLFLEGQDGDRLYVVLDGKIKLTRAAADGRENLLSVLGPGEMFGELSLFDPRPRTSSASAVTDATCCRRWPSGCGGRTT